jgi:hypothetical protein
MSLLELHYGWVVIGGDGGGGEVILDQLQWKIYTQHGQ